MYSVIVMRLLFEAVNKLCEISCLILCIRHPRFDLFIVLNNISIENVYFLH